MASDDQRLPSYLKPRVTCARRQRRPRRRRAMASTESNGEDPSTRSVIEASRRRRVSMDNRSLTHSSDAGLLPKEGKCCLARWRERPNSIKRVVSVLLVVFAILKMVGGMIFGSIHVVLSYSSSEVTEDLQNPLPIYLSAVMIAVSGLCDMVLSKLRPPYLILTGMFFTISSCVITLAGLLSSATVSLPKFTSFVHFQFHANDKTCVAYTRWDILQNGTFTGGILFHELPGCSLVESTLPPLILTLVVFYGVSCFTSFAVCFLLSVLLCLPEKDKKLERIRKASMSSYVNYDLNLDHICDEIPWGQESPRNHQRDLARKSNTDGSNYLPGVAIPYYTVPYRIPLVHCRPATAGAYNSGSTPQLTLNQIAPDSSKCRCNGSAANTVFSRRFRSPAASATADMGLRSWSQRPIIPIEFRCIDSNGLATENDRLQNRLTGSRSRPLRISQKTNRERNTDRRESRSSPRRDVVFSVKKTGRFRGRRERQSSVCRGSAEISPPPYAELPPYEGAGPAEIGKEDQVQDSERAGSSHLHEETIF